MPDPQDPLPSLNSAKVRNASDDVLTFLSKVALAGPETRAKEHKWLVGRERSAEHFAANPSKNRDNRIVLYDDTRVPLKPNKAFKGDTDYINASYVNNGEFILAQTPLKETVVDFWRMVWQEKIAVIVSLEPPKALGGVIYYPKENDSIKIAGGRFKIKAKGKSSRVPTGDQSFEEFADKLKSGECHWVMLEVYKDDEEFWPALINPDENNDNPWAQGLRDAYAVTKPVYVNSRDKIIRKVQTEDECFVGVDYKTVETYYHSRLMQSRLNGKVEKPMPDPQDPLPSLNSAKVRNASDDVLTFLSKVALAGPETRAKEHKWLVGRERSAEHFAANPSKNRDNRIVLYDDTRVPLKPNKAFKGDTDYINASYVNNGEFILAQTPLKETVVDFWRMVWQEKIAVIVSLEPPKALGGVIYYPKENDSIKIAGGRFKIKAKGKSSRVPTGDQSFEEFADKLKSGECHWVMLEVYKDDEEFWPALINPDENNDNPWAQGLRDAYAVTKPVYVNSRDKIIRKVQTEDECFVGVDYKTVETYYHSSTCYLTNLQWMEMKPMPDPQDPLPSLNSAKVRNASDDVLTFLSKVALAGPETRAKEHKWLVGRERSAEHFAANPSKNRDNRIVLYDDTRVPLKPNKAFKGDTDYINASYVNNGEFILAQTPLKETVVDFWRMVWQEKIAVIVSLEPPKALGGVIYYPKENDSIKIAGGRFKIKAKGKSSRVPTGDQDFEVRELLVEAKEEEEKGETKRNVTFLNFRFWKEEELPGSSILRFMELVQESSTAKAQFGKSREEGPILIHCLSGVKKSGTFAALCMICKEYQRSGGCEVKNIASQVAGDRYGTLTFPAHYQFLYTKLLEFAVHRKEIDPHDTNYQRFLNRMRT